MPPYLPRLRSPSWTIGSLFLLIALRELGGSLSRLEGTASASAARRYAGVGPANEATWVSAPFTAVRGGVVSEIASVVAAGVAKLSVSHDTSMKSSLRTVLLPYVLVRRWSRGSLDFDEKIFRLF